MGQGVEFGNRGVDPFDCGAPANLFVAAQQAAARLGSVIGQQHACPRATGTQCRHQAGGASAGHQHVAMPVPCLVGSHHAVGIWRKRQTGRAPDMRLVDMPVRPHEGLVVERRRQHARKQLVEREHIEPGRRPTVDRARLQPVAQLHRRDGLAARLVVAQQLHERRRFFLAGAGDAARTVVLEAARREPLAVGQQRRRERVAWVAGVAAAVEAEPDGACAVYSTALIQPHRFSWHLRSWVETGESWCRAEARSRHRSRAHATISRPPVQVDYWARSGSRPRPRRPAPTGPVADACGPDHRG